MEQADSQPIGKAIARGPQPIDAVVLQVGTVGLVIRGGLAAPPGSSVDLSFCVGPSRPPSWHDAQTEVVEAHHDGSGWVLKLLFTEIESEAVDEISRLTQRLGSRYQPLSFFGGEQNRSPGLEVERHKSSPLPRRGATEVAAHQPARISETNDPTGPKTFLRAPRGKTRLYGTKE